MEDLNRALVAKRGWELLSKKDSIWVQALHAKYCRGSSPLNAPLSGASWAWHSILKSKDLVEAGFCWAIRDGKSVNLWCDPWVPNLVNFLPRLKEGVVVDRHLNRVSDLIHPHTHGWKEDVIRDLGGFSMRKVLIRLRKHI